MVFSGGYDTVSQTDNNSMHTDNISDNNSEKVSLWGVYLYVHM